MFKIFCYQSFLRFWIFFHLKNSKLLNNFLVFLLFLIYRVRECLINRNNSHSTYNFFHFDVINYSQFLSQRSRHLNNINYHQMTFAEMRARKPHKLRFPATQYFSEQLLFACWPFFSRTCTKEQDFMSWPCLLFTVKDAKNW